MSDFKLYRKRYIPNEIIYLKDDKIIYKDDNKIVTKWNVLNHRNDFTNGISCYFINEGYKISKFMNDNGELVYYYCDVIDVHYDEKNKSYIFDDLLADVIIYPDGKIKVVDIEEIADALDDNIISCDITKKALRRLSSLLDIIYSDRLFCLIGEYFE